MTTQPFTSSDDACINNNVPRVPWREADVIHALRIECGWLAKDLAKRAGLNKSVVYRLEDGSVKDPTPKTLEKIAGAFGITLRELRNAVPEQPIVLSTQLPGPLQKSKGEELAPTHQRRRSK